MVLSRGFVPACTFPCLFSDELAVWEPPLPRCSFQFLCAHATARSVSHLLPSGALQIVRTWGGGIMGEKTNVKVARAKKEKEKEMLAKLG